MQQRTGSFGIELTLVDTRAAAVLHNESGFADFGPAGSTYYYSRPRMAATGTLTLDGAAIPVQGSAWFDHQWGDFIAVGGGSGWDWFADQPGRRNGRDALRPARPRRQRARCLRHVVAPRRDGRDRSTREHVRGRRPVGSWTSPNTGATYPAGWQVSIPGDGLEINLTPTLSDQELDTRPTSGVIYWEGSQVVTATRNGTPLGGEAYVELTGYAANQ